jgi:hypothetical protein
MFNDAGFPSVADGGGPTYPRPLQTILYGGLLVGVLDITYAFSFWWLKGVGPVRILQSIASGLLGPDAYRGGAKTAALGAALHFLIAFTIAAVYYAASLKLPAVFWWRPYIYGPLYGVAVYFFMNYVVIPLSAMPPASSFNPVWFIFSVFAHAFLVGLPVALLARHSAMAD